MTKQLTTICPKCNGGCIPSEGLTCRVCRNRGELPAWCECGQAAVVTINDEPLCKACAKEKEEDAE